MIIITSSDTSAYQRAVKSMLTELNNNELLTPYTREYWTLETIKEKQAAASIGGGGSFVVTIGSAAANYAVNHIEDTPIICGFITRNAFDVISSEAKPQQLITAVFIDQPIKRLIQLSTLLRKQQSPYKIGMLSQSISADQKLANVIYGQGNDIQINTAKLSMNDNPIKQIEPLMKGSDVFIVRPNTSLFNRLVAKLVLQLSMRYKTPVIGFSEKYAKAGALLSLYASPENIGVDTSELIKRWMDAAQKILPPPSDGNQFSITINQRIAQKHGVTLSAEVLKAELKRREGY